jgi:hypothetical protein
VNTTATRPAVESVESSPLSASDAAQLAAWYARYALDRLGDDSRNFHPGVRSHLAAACREHEAAGKAFGLAHTRNVEREERIEPSIWSDTVVGDRT